MLLKEFKCVLGGINGFLDIPFLLVLHAQGTEKLLCCRIRDPDSVSGQRFCNEGEVLSSKLSAGCSAKEI